MPEDKLNKIQKKFKDNFFKIPNFKPIQSVDNSTVKRVLLDPVKIRSFADLSKNDREYLESVLGVTENDFGEIPVEMSVDNFRPQTMLKAVLPTGEVEGEARSFILIFLIPFAIICGWTNAGTVVIECEMLV